MVGNSSPPPTLSSAQGAAGSELSGHESVSPPGSAKARSALSQVRRTLTLHKAAAPTTLLRLPRGWTLCTFLPLAHSGDASPHGRLESRHHVLCSPPPAGGSAAAPGGNCAGRCSSSAARYLPAQGTPLSPRPGGEGSADPCTRSLCPAFPDPCRAPCNGALAPKFALSFSADALLLCWEAAGTELPGKPLPPRRCG